MSLFEDVKNNIDIIHVAERYGVHVKHNKAYCPFHNDTKTPNLSFKKQFYKCFACGAGGDVIDFVARLHGINQREAAHLINTDFGLGLTEDIPRRSYAEIAKKKQADKLLQTYKQWEYDTFTELSEQFRRYTYITNTLPPFSDAWCIAMHRLPIIEYKLDIIMSDDAELKIKWFKDEVKKVGDYDARQGTIRNVI